jgi:hypothetical protein
MENKSNKTNKHLQPHPLLPNARYNPELDKYADLPPPQKTLDAIKELKKVGLPKEYYEEHGPIVNWREY